MILGLGYKPDKDAKFVINTLLDLEKTFKNKLMNQRGLFTNDLIAYLDKKQIIWKKKIFKINERINSKNEGEFWWKYNENDRFEFHVISTGGFVFRCLSFEIEGFEATLDYDKFNKSFQLGVREYKIDFMDRSKKTSSKATSLANKILEINKRFEDQSEMHL